MRRNEEEVHLLLVELDVLDPEAAAADGVRLLVTVLLVTRPG